MSENIEDVPNVLPEGRPEGSTVKSDLLDVDREVLEGASDVLLLGPMRGTLDDDACTSLLRTLPVAGRNVLCVSLTQSADERFGLLRDGLESGPGRVCVVSGADRYSSETTTGSGGETTLSVSVVRDPSDLPRLGMTISRAVDDWTDDDAIACFHSLTALLQYAEPKRVFRFVHLLQNRLDATTHYHMDAEAHDRQTVATLRPLFDAVVEYDADGNATVTD